MFSQQQLENFAQKRRITQETFDAAVQENIDEFDMEPEEALESAIAEFKAQGVDLSNLILTTSGGDVTEHPAAQAIEQLSASSGTNQTAIAAAFEKLNTLLASCSISSSSASVQKQQDPNQLGAVLFKANAVPVIIEILNNPSTTCDNQVAALLSLRKILLLSADHRKLFRASEGIPILVTTLRSGGGSNKNDNKAAAYQVAASCAFKDEDGKGALMTAGIGPLALGSLQGATLCDTLPNELIIGACAVLSAVTTADDDTQPSSRAFPNARALGKESAAPIVTGVLLRYETVAPEAVLATLRCLRQVCANEEICKEAADSGAVTVILKIANIQLGALATATSNNESTKESANLLRAALSALRQLASSDAIKNRIVNADGLDFVRDVLDFALQAPEVGGPGAMPIPVVEHALGLLTNITLRNPDAATKAHECDALDRALKVMKAILPIGAGGNVGAIKALRQGCMAVRNAVVRCPELRQPMLERGAEGIIRAAKKVGPEECGDVGSSALRDLGLEHYND